ncbi:glycosyltransferase family 1 protein [Backusella circina FSU 941]|nr:glycosyltransferase family 1 protein [Backusella circina FSU 941]
MVSILQSFREPKKIGFAGTGGGSTHFNWVLGIMDELADRGHNVTFFAKDDSLRFGKPFPNIKTVSIGESYKFDMDSLLDDSDSRLDIFKILPVMMKASIDTMEQDFKLMVDYIKRYELDVILCDHLFEQCINAAKEAKVPFIAASSYEMTKDSSAPYVNNNFFTMAHPTTETESILDRFYKNFIIPLKMLKTIWPHIQELKKIKKSLGITSSGDHTADWKDSMKLVNSVFGLTPARPMGPLVEAVGPIMPKKYQPLDEDLKSYLDAHERVAYIAFGQNAAPSKDDIHVILTALMETIESGDLDGFLWATVHAGDRFPDYITTASNTKYNVLDMFQNKNPNARMVKWAPQTAILFHPSTYLFVSHGGLGSWVESLYAGVRMVMFPFFGDQPGNAILNERAKVGGILEREHTPQEATALFKRITRDEDGEIAKGVKRFQSLVQIHSTHGIMKGADAVEEVAFVNVDGKLPHRYPASRNMNYFKAHNIDLYGLLALVVLSSFSALFYGSKMVYKTVTSSSSQKKVKTL